MPEYRTFSVIIGLLLKRNVKWCSEFWLTNSCLKEVVTLFLHGTWLHVLFLIFENLNTAINHVDEMKYTGFRCSIYQDLRAP